jgi:hypothetical protein
MKMQPDPALMADVQTTALIMCGRTEMPARVKAMTKGDCCAVPVDIVREGSLEGLEMMLVILQVSCRDESRGEPTQ